MNGTGWLKEIEANDDNWVDVTELNCVPTPIVYAYDRLRTLAREGNVYGTILEIKDFFELIIKLPVVISFMFIDKNGIDVEDDTILNLVRAFIGKPLSMGDWASLSKSIAKSVEKKNISLPEPLVHILNESHKLFGEDIKGSDKNNIVHWRNVVVGHGSLKLEEDESYKIEISFIVNMIKEYFLGESSSITDSYSKIHILLDGTRLSGFDGYDRLVEVKKNDLSIRIEEELLTNDMINNYAESGNNRIFFYESYYSNKMRTKYSSYSDGKDNVIRNSYFDSLYNRIILERPKRKSIKKTMTRGDLEFLELLDDSDTYCKPQKLIDEINDYIKSNRSGTIMIHMERGTGKSAFANQIDGLYHSKPIFEDSFSRGYHVSRAVVRGYNDFFKTVSFEMKHLYDKSKDRVDTEYDCVDITDDTDDPAKNFADMLNSYHRNYMEDEDCDYEHTVFVFDGIDEITVDIKRILDYIPTSDLLDDDVYVILLSRFSDEDTVKPSSAKYIKRCDSIADMIIDVDRESDYNMEILNSFVKDSNVDKFELIEKSDHRVLYLKALLQVGEINSNFLITDSESRFIESFFNLISAFYGPKGRGKIRKMLAAIAMFPGLSLEDYIDYMDCSYIDMNYELLGRLNDIKPLLTITRSSQEPSFEMADEGYSEWIIKEFDEECKEVIKNLMESVDVESITKEFYDERINVFPANIDDEFIERVSEVSRWVIRIVYRALSTVDLQETVFSSWNEMLLDFFGCVTDCANIYKQEYIDFYYIEDCIRDIVTRIALVDIDDVCTDSLKQVSLSMTERFDKARDDENEYRLFLLKPLMERASREICAKAIEKGSVDVLRRNYWAFYLSSPADEGYLVALNEKGCLENFLYYLLDSKEDNAGGFYFERVLNHDDYMDFSESLSLECKECVINRRIEILLKREANGGIGDIRIAGGVRLKSCIDKAKDLCDILEKMGGKLNERNRTVLEEYSNPIFRIDRACGFLNGEVFDMIDEEAEYIREVCKWIIGCKKRSRIQREYVDVDITENYGSGVSELDFERFDSALYNRIERELTNCSDGEPASHALPFINELDLPFVDINIDRACEGPRIACPYYIKVVKDKQGDNWVEKLKSMTFEMMDELHGYFVLAHGLGADLYDLNVSPFPILYQFHMLLNHYALLGEKSEYDSIMKRIGFCIDMESFAYNTWHFVEKNLWLDKYDLIRTKIKKPILCSDYTISLLNIYIEQNDIKSIKGLTNSVVFTLDVINKNCCGMSRCAASYLGKQFFRYFGVLRKCNVSKEYDVVLEKCLKLTRDSYTRFMDKEGDWNYRNIMFLLELLLECPFQNEDWDSGIDMCQRILEGFEKKRTDGIESDNNTTFLDEVEDYVDDCLCMFSCLAGNEGEWEVEDEKGISKYVKEYNKNNMIQFSLPTNVDSFNNEREFGNPNKESMIDTVRNFDSTCYRPDPDIFTTARYEEGKWYY